MCSSVIWHCVTLWVLGNWSAFVNLCLGKWDQAFMDAWLHLWGFRQVWGGPATM